MEKKHTLFIHCEDDGAIAAADSQFLLRSLAMEDPNIQRPADITKELETALEHFYPLARLVHETCDNDPGDQELVSWHPVSLKMDTMMSDWLANQLRKAKTAFFTKLSAS